jgi:hypothetical protein
MSAANFHNELEANAANLNNVPAEDAAKLNNVPAEDAAKLNNELEADPAAANLNNVPAEDASDVSNKAADPPKPSLVVKKEYGIRHSQVHEDLNLSIYMSDGSPRNPNQSKGKNSSGLGYFDKYHKSR